MPELSTSQVCGLIAATFLAIVVGDHIAAKNGKPNLGSGAKWLGNTLTAWGKIVGDRVAFITTYLLEYIDLKELCDHAYHLVVDVLYVPVSFLWGYIVGFCDFLKTIDRWTYTGLALACTAYPVYYFLGWQGLVSYIVLVAIGFVHVFFFHDRFSVFTVILLYTFVGATLYAILGRGKSEQMANLVAHFLHVQPPYPQPAD